MIPILYEKDETAFATNGLGRLRDCISCVVTEERNSIYECEFEYPITGRNYDLIQIGRVIGVEHDDSDDIQPFDIVSSTKPIDGVVTFHCTHISYRLSKVVASGTNVTGLDGAFEMLASGEPASEFAFWTDKESSMAFPLADGVPRSVRSMLGGIEGSILDTYGGEYEWDRFNVKLWNSRGTDASFTIRYGLNMTEFEDESDSANTYSAVVPYWTGDVNGTQTTVKGDMVDSGLITPSGRTECIPMDMSQDFESQPTAAELEASALLKINSDRPNILAQSIKVSFVRLQDSGEYTQFENLLGCKLCDTVNVEFPRYNMSGRFKIVKTVYDVLGERFTSMELGKLSTTLSEALGIGSSSGSGSSSGGGGSDITEIGVSGIWTYRKWRSGIAECWGTQTITTATATSPWGSAYYGTLTSSLTFPADLFTGKPEILVSLQSANGRFWATHGNDATATSVGTIFNLAPQAYPTASTVTLGIYAIGMWDTASWDGGATPVVAVTDYNTLLNKPQIEGVTLAGDKTYEDLNLEGLDNLEIESLINSVV